jgi:hypothetical protein
MAYQHQIKINKIFLEMEEIWIGGQNVKKIKIGVECFELK